MLFCNFCVADFHLTIAIPKDAVLLGKDFGCAAPMTSLPVHVATCRDIRFEGRA